MVAHRERGRETQFERDPLPPPPGLSTECWYFSVLRAYELLMCPDSPRPAQVLAGS